MNGSNDEESLAEAVLEIDDLRELDHESSRRNGCIWGFGADGST